ncbi:hypothetical protein AB0L88_25915 [Saccharopolyspora shandongensis]|uniref:Uncharacterized protein n=1 Tax=Saccharopolyspora shandongensis TaxID=418495 RepID=A0A1H3T095_9PSEU|nr:hypothetical protein [Saccharopolyspora shandongensis]SDZ42769.1 hypothetical protein SAMN05216215_107226 [Saccharopolyspora shandongensis]
MSAMDPGVIAPESPQSFSSALDQVLFHMGSALNDEQANKVAGYLEGGKALPAAEALASIAAAKRRMVSREDRNILRTVIETYNGDLTHISSLESQAVTDAPTVTIKAPRLLGLA